MKKKTIWTIAIIMGFSFLALLYLQLSYIQEMVNMKKEQFDESVNRALYQASRNLELNETLRYLEKDVNETERKANKDKNKGTAVYSTFELKTNATHPGNMPKAMILRSDKNSLTETQKSLQEIVKNRYVYQKALLDEVVYSILLFGIRQAAEGENQLQSSSIRTSEAEMMNNGINIPLSFHRDYPGWTRGLPLS